MTASPWSASIRLGLAVLGLAAPAGTARSASSPDETNGMNAKPSAPSASHSPLDCWIRTEVAGGSLHIAAMAKAPSGLRGHFALAVSKSSEAGTSRTMQRGAFTLEPGQQQVLAGVSLEASAVGHVRAAMTVETDLGNASCELP